MQDLSVVSERHDLLSSFDKDKYSSFARCVCGRKPSMADKGRPGKQEIVSALNDLTTQSPEKDSNSAETLWTLQRMFFWESIASDASNS
jgi:hypothetical protein